MVSSGVDQLESCGAVCTFVEAMRAFFEPCARRGSLSQPHRVQRLPLLRVEN